jgi:hypothetical protein
MPQLSRHAQAMSAEAFDQALALHPRIQSTAAEAARAVLVDGLSCAAAGKKHGVTRQRVHAAVSTLHQDETPEGWERRIVTLPPELMQQVLQMEHEARAKAGRGGEGQ